MKNIYKDLNLSFEKHPLTGDVVKAVDTEAIRKSLRHLIQTDLYDVPFQPDKGTGIRDSLFENFSPVGVDFLRSKIVETVGRYEPRVNVQEVVIVQREERNVLEVSIYYKVVELNRLDEITVFVERTR